MAATNGYNTANNSSSHAVVGPSSDEEQSLLGHPIKISSWRKNLSVNIHRDWADVVLLACYIITGLLDSASISTWGSFVSMQTG